MADLLIVESPAKAKTINKYLGKDFVVMATMGHIIDLPSNKISVNIEKDFEPEFAVMEGKSKVISELKKAVPKNGEVYLAMDPDREGEAIAWHTASALKLKNARRVTFHEITKDAILGALKTPGKIDQNLVSAQFARRVLDRLVGYKLSQLLWKKIWYGLSAGRVQSVALKLIVEREKEIEKFIPEEFWEIRAVLKDNIMPLLQKIDNKKVNITNGRDAEAIKSNVIGSDLVVDTVSKKEVRKNPFPPFTTSTLQQAANNILGLGTKKTMVLAQELYQRGYISYMRTDSVTLSAQALDNIRKTILGKYGKAYVPDKPNFYKNRARLAQEAHEAIRPTDFSVGFAEISTKVGAMHAKLYKLIYDRTLASQMTQQVSEKMSVYFKCAGKDRREYLFGIGGEKVIFDGFRRVWSVKHEEEILFGEDYKEGQKFICKDIKLDQKFTQPKARYSEASLVKALEKYGVGRPSTYATIISTIIERGYVEKIQKSLKPKDVGFVVSDFLDKSFHRLVDYEYTANVEEDLDRIAEGKVQYLPFIRQEYNPLEKELALADKEVSKESIVVLGSSEENCPECGAKMIVRLGRYGRFLSCSKFPECKGIKSLESKEKIEFDESKYLPALVCAKCGKDMVLKSGRFGLFWACTDYPNCKGVAPLLLRENCPECGKPLTEKKGRWGKSFIGCSGYPDCHYIKGRSGKPSSKGTGTKRKSKVKSKARRKTSSSARKRK